MYEQEFIETQKLIEGQNQWRLRTINLIASENVMSRKVRMWASTAATSGMTSRPAT